MSKTVVRQVVAAITQDAQQHEIGQVILKFGGGEPLLELPLIAFFTKHAREVLLPLGVKVSSTVITNGTLLTREIADILKREGIRIGVSLDGLRNYNDARVYPSGETSFSDVVKGIDTLIQTDLHPTILTTISNQNVSELPALYEFVKARKLSLNLSLSREYDPTYGLVLDTTRVVENLIPFLITVATDVNDQLCTRLGFIGISFMGKKQKSCGANISYFGVSPQGTVSSCPMTIETPLLDRIPIEEGFTILSESYTPPTMCEQCKQCMWRYSCYGGCELLARQAGTLANQPSVFCQILKNALPWILTIEGRWLQKEKDNKMIEHNG